MSGINPSTIPGLKPGVCSACLSVGTVDTERHFLPRPEGRGLAPSKYQSLIKKLQGLLCRLFFDFSTTPFQVLFLHPCPFPVRDPDKNSSNGRPPCSSGRPCHTCCGQSESRVKSFANPLGHSSCHLWTHSSIPLNKIQRNAQMLCLRLVTVVDHSPHKIIGTP